MSLRSLSPARTVVYANGQINRAGTKITRSIYGEEIILSRALCHYERIPMASGRSSFKSAQAALLAAKTRAPMPNPGFRFCWHKDELGVWSWDKTILEPLGQYEASVYPESLLQPDLNDGCRLIENMDGVEGQIWKGAKLAYSRWWPECPSEQDWVAFLRASRFNTHSERPEIITANKAAKTPKSNLIEHYLHFEGPKFKDILCVILLFFLVPALYFSGEWLSLILQKNHLLAKLDALSEQTEQVAELQQSTQRDSLALNIYSTRLNRTHPSKILAQLTQIAEDFDVQINRFELLDEEISAIISTSDAFRPAEFVTTLELEPDLFEVRVEPTRRSNSWQVNARIDID